MYTHFIFITLHRDQIISENHRERIEKYITGIVNNNHCHLYSSERFINDNKLCKGHFAWQESAAASSVSKSDIDKVCKYIFNQPEHHKKETFAQEYEKFIKFYQGTLQPFSLFKIK